MSKKYQCRGYLFILRNILKLSAQQIADECGVSYTTINVYLKNPKQLVKKNKILCKFCSKPIKFHKIECIPKIINIKQNPKILQFCDRECKLNYIYQIQKEIKENELKDMRNAIQLVLDEEIKEKGELI